MSSLRLTACAFALMISLPLPASVAAPPVPDALVGLWKAKKRFGPDATGTLIIEGAPGRYVADIAGHRVAVEERGGELSFALPGDRGRFSGRREGRAIRGHWFRPATPVNSSGYASPVELQPDGPGVWSGTAAALQDEFTFFLWIERRPDGSYRAVLRNPERDVGTQLGVRSATLDGSQLRLIGGRPGQPEEAVATGSFNPDSRSFTLIFPNRGGTYDFAPDGEASDFYPRGRRPARYAYAPPPRRNDGWRTGTLEQAAIDRTAMERLVQTIAGKPMDAPDAPQIHALLIARHGRLVLEEYFHGYSREMLHDTRSASKSVTSVLVGAAMRAGTPLELSSPVYKVMNGGRFPDGLDPGKRRMTLEHLLTMSSGYYCDDTDDAAPGNEEVMQEQTAEPDWLHYTLRVPLVTPAGEKSVYCSASPNLALGMLGAATGETPLRSFDRLVGAPLGIRSYAWFLDPTGRPYGGGGLRLRARDFIKFGQLMLDEGKWQGRAVLDPGFARQAVSPAYNLRNLTYGYLWWVEDYPYKHRTVRSFSARGAGGQVVTVVPDLDLVVATMAGNYFSRISITDTGTIVPRLILPAVREPGDDPHAPVVERPFETRTGRSSDGSRIAPRS